MSNPAFKDYSATKGRRASEALENLGPDSPTLGRCREDQDGEYGSFSGDTLSRKRSKSRGRTPEHAPESRLESESNGTFASATPEKTNGPRKLVRKKSSTGSSRPDYNLYNEHVDQGSQVATKAPGSAGNEVPAYMKANAYTSAPFLDYSSNGGRSISSTGERAAQSGLASPIGSANALGLEKLSLNNTTTESALSGATSEDQSFRSHSRSRNNGKKANGVEANIQSNPDYASEANRATKTSRRPKKVPEGLSTSVNHETSSNSTDYYDRNTDPNNIDHVDDGNVNGQDYDYAAGDSRMQSGVVRKPPRKTKTDTKRSNSKGAEDAQNGVGDLVGERQFLNSSLPNTEPVINYSHRNRKSTAEPYANVDDEDVAHTSVQSAAAALKSKRRKSISGRSTKSSKSTKARSPRYEDAQDDDQQLSSNISKTPVEKLVLISILGRKESSKSFNSHKHSSVYEDTDEQSESEDSAGEEPIDMAKNAVNMKGRGNFMMDNQLTPVDRHYLNKILISLQMQREFSLLSQIGTLANYGPPFSPHPTGPNTQPLTNRASGRTFGYFSSGGNVSRKAGWEDFQWKGQNVKESPILRYLYWRFIYNFPALRLAKPEYWTQQIQPFFDSFAERDLSTTRERSEVTKRRLLSLGLTRILSTFYSTCLRPLGHAEPSRPSIPVMRHIDGLYPGSMDSMWKTQRPGSAIAYNAWTAIVGLEGGRRAGDKFVIISRVVVIDTKPVYVVHRSWSKFQSLASYLNSVDPKNKLDVPLIPSPMTSGAPSMSLLQRYLRNLIIALSSPPSHMHDSEELTSARNKLEEFLLGKPERLQKSELNDYLADAQREDEKLEDDREKWATAGKRAKSLRTTWTLYRRALINSDEVDESIRLTKRHPKIGSLPESYRDAVEWASIWVAYALHYIFVAGPNAKEILQLLKSFHDLIPYGALKLGLSLVNPTIAIKTIVAIFMGQPAGQPSLFQRIFSIVLGFQIKAQKKTIDRIHNRLDNASLITAVKDHVYSSFAGRQATREASSALIYVEHKVLTILTIFLLARDPEAAGEDIIITIVKDNGSRHDAEMVEEWHTNFVKRSLAQSGKEDAYAEDNSQAGKYQSLKNLLSAYCKKRDREQVLEIVAEHNTPVMIKASISVFYDSIYKVANAANLSARLGDLQAFLDDLIKTGYSDKHEAADFIKLTMRHNQSLYFFIHELASNGGTLLDPLIEWSKSGLQFIRVGIPVDATVVTNLHRRSSSASRKSARKAPPPSPRTTRAGVNYDELVSQAPQESQGAILAEVRGLALWTAYKKAWADICLRADLLAIQHPEFKIDKELLYSDLLSQDREVLAFLDEREAVDGDRPEDKVGWAWFADEDVLDDPTAIKVDWKAAAKAEKDLVEARKREKKNAKSKKLSRTASQATAASRGDNSTYAAGDDDHDKEGDQRKIPNPRVVATKSLLDDFIASISQSLISAREASLK